jgi:hypothetical protein
MGKLTFHQKQEKERIDQKLRYTLQTFCNGLVVLIFVSNFDIAII